jgi:hypothetical protein
VIRRLRTGALLAALAGTALGPGAGCEGATGTLAVELTEAPGSGTLANLARIRLTLTEPRTVVEAARGEPLALEVDADGGAGEIFLEGFDAAGSRVAVARSGPLPIAAIDAAVTLHVAPPVSMGAARATLDPPRSAIGAAALPYGVVYAGGRSGAGTAVDSVAIYSVYAHAFLPGERLPAPRADLAIGMGGGGWAYLFGGVDTTGAATGSLWRFDTNAAPDGEYLQAQGAPTLARSGAAVARLAGERFLVTGTPPALLDGATLTIQGLPTPDVLGGSATTTIDPADETIAVVFAGVGAGATGVVLFADDAFAEIAAPAEVLRTGHGAVALAGGVVALVGGRDASDAVLASIVRIDLTAGAAVTTVSTVADALATPRSGAAVAVTGDLLAVVGGTGADGTVLADVELLDRTTLARRAVLPLAVGRTGASAQTLANGQVLIVGGLDSTGAPIATVELFTPELPAL